jgi:hypothetical protein
VPPEAGAGKRQGPKHHHPVNGAASRQTKPAGSDRDEGQAREARVGDGELGTGSAAVALRLARDASPWDPNATVAAATSSRQVPALALAPVGADSLLGAVAPRAGLAAVREHPTGPGAPPTEVPTPTDGGLLEQVTAQPPPQVRRGAEELMHTAAPKPEPPS